MKKLLFCLIVFLLGTVVAVDAQDEKSAADAYNEGVEKLKAKSYEEAFSLFEEAITLSEGDTSSTAEQVLSLAKKNGARAAYYLSNDQRKAKEYETAIATVDKGLAMSDFYVLYSTKALSLDKLGKSEEAVAAYFLAGDKYAEAKQPEDKVISYYKRAYIALYKAKDWDAIIESSEKYPTALNDPSINYYIAKALVAKKDNTKAIDFATKATSLAEEGEDNGKYYMLEGEIYTNLTNTGKAIEAYNNVASDSKYAERAQYLVKQLGGS